MARTIDDAGVHHPGEEGGQFLARPTDDGVVEVVPVPDPLEELRFELRLVDLVPRHKPTATMRPMTAAANSVTARTHSPPEWRWSLKRLPVKTGANELENESWWIQGRSNRPPKKAATRPAAADPHGTAETAVV
jgi:hypothetical protein